MTDNELFLLIRNKFGAAKRANNHWVRVKCPTCSPRDAMKLKRGIHLRTLSTNCFICKKPLSLSQIFGDTPVIPACGGLIEEPKEHPQARLWPCKAVIPVSALKEDHPAVQFLAKDHLTERLRYWMDYKVGYITAEDAEDILFERVSGGTSAISTAHSLVFPVYHNKEFVGWQLRFIPGTPNGDRMNKMKYLHVFPKGNYLYNYDIAKEFNSVVLVEGVKKSWKFPNGVASLGKGITERQIQMLQMRWNDIIIMYDGDDRTQEQASTLKERILLNGHRCINIDPRKYKFASPDEMTTEEAQMIVYKEWTAKYGSE